MKTNTNEVIVLAELNQLELQQKQRLEEFNLYKNAFSIAGVEAVEYRAFLKLIYLDVMKVCCSIKRKTINLIKQYKEDVNVIERRIVFLRTKKNQSKEKVPKMKKKRHGRNSLITSDEKFRSYNGALSFYFHTESERCKFDNEDLLTLHQLGYRFLSCLHVPRVWLNSDRDRLLDAVSTEVKHHYLSELKDLYSMQTGNKERGVLLSVERANEITKYLREFDGPTSPDLLQVESKMEFDWNSISKKYFSDRHDPEEVQSMWKLVANSDVRNKKWTLAEDLVLRRLAIDNDLQNWEKINELMPTRRTGFLCFSRYTSVYKRKLRICKKWTTKGDTKIECGQNNGQLFGKSNSRGKKERRAGRFSKREKFVANNYFKRGYSYKAIANILKNRTVSQICDHYRMSVRRQNCKKWTSNDNRDLLLSVRYFGKGNWKTISVYMHERTPDQCRKKFNQLLRNRKSYVEKCLNKKFATTKTLLKDIKEFLSRRRRTKNHFEKKLELYFLLHLDGKVQKKRGKQDVLSEHALKLLQFLDFNVTCVSEYTDELNSWLMNYPLSDCELKLNCDKFFVKKFRMEMKTSPVKTVQHVFSHIINRSGKVLPPNKCTLYGLHKFMENCEGYIEKNGEIDFEILWKLQNQNLKQTQKKYFNESRVLWYRVLKAIFFWPSKLKMVMSEDLL